MGVPDPLKERPSISILIGMRSTSPVNSTCVCRLSMPEVPSNIYTLSGLRAYLHDGSLAGDLEHLALPGAPVSKSYIHNFRVSIRDAQDAARLTWGT